MADAEILRSIDRTLERIDGHMERGNLHMERGNTVFEENRWFTRDLIRRQEKFMKGVMDELARQAAATNELRVAIGRDHREIVEELRAGRSALFRVLDRLDRLDRLDGGDAPAGA